MKHILLLNALFLSPHIFAQCPYSARIKSKADFCLGSTLEVTSSHALSKIVWYRDGIALDSNAITKTYATAGITVAGGHGSGAAANQFTSPVVICVDDAGNIYVQDQGNGRIQKWAPGAGSGVTLLSVKGCQPTTNEVEYGGIALDGQGNLYASDPGNSRVVKWAPGATCGITVAGGNGAGAADNQLNDPDHIYADCDGNIYIEDVANSRIQKWAPGASSGTTVATVPYSISAWSDLDPITVDAAGNIYIAGGDKILKWIPGTGSWATVAGGNGQGSNADQISQCEGLFVDYRGNMFVLDLQNNRVQEWTPGATSGITLVTGPRASNGYNDQFWGLCFDKKGDIYVGDILAESIVEWKMQSPPIDSTFTPTVAGKYTAVCFDMYGYPVTTDTVLFNDRQAGNPTIRINATATSISVCTPVTFTATTGNAGLAPSFQWQVSGVNVGGNDPVYSNNLFANGDQVLCILSADVGCTGQPQTDTSNVITLAVDPHGTASVSIATSSDNVCKGDTVSLQATVTNGSANPIFQWTVNGVNVNDDSASYSSNSLVSGDVVYCTIVSDNNCGLAKSNSIPLTVNDPPSIEAGQVFMIPHGTSQPLDPVVTGDIASYLWTPSTGLSDPAIRDPVAQPMANTLYTLLVISPAGCRDSTTILVDVFTPLRIPNAFTPNGDGRNDIFFVLGGPENSRIEDFSIFNRWGQRVFQVHDVAPGDPAYGWNGSIHGAVQPAGMYVYLVTMQYGDGSRQVYKGTVMLIR